MFQSKPVTIDSLVESYLCDNDGNRLVEIEAAGTVPQRVEAIITQKYIAMNMITSDESYNEFRRTGFPVTVPGRWGCGGYCFEQVDNNRAFRIACQPGSCIHRLSSLSIQLTMSM
jgi:hypothetical protein